MMRQGTWKIIKLNMWLAREEVPATVVMMLLAAVSLFCISGMLLLCLLGFICMVIGCIRSLGKTDTETPLFS